jgi:hypothetical protein
MKSIGYMDITEGRTINIFNPEYKQKQRSIFDLKRHERITEGLQELRHTGNIIIYLINGNKYRPILERRT